MLSQLNHENHFRLGGGIFTLSFSAFLCLTPPSVHAGEADVVNVKVRCPSSCTFNVTVRHADTGWDHYADQWDIVAADGTVLASRKLYHPHVQEQPFTRSLSGVRIAADIKHVKIKAKDSVHGYGGLEQQVSLPDRSSTRD